MTPAEERVDLVDEDDRVLGTVTRAEVRAGTLLHRGVAILVRDSAGRVYVHRRTADKDVFPSAYDMFVGGMVAAGEGYDAAAERELAEELGIRGVPLRPLFRHRSRGPDNNWHGAVYEVCWDGPVHPQASEIAWGTWLTLDELRARMRRWAFVPDGTELFERWLREQDDARR